MSAASCSRSAVGHRADGLGLRQRLEVGLDGVHLGQVGEDLALDLRGDVVRLREGERARELEVERDLGAIARAEDGDVVDLAHARNPERGGECALGDRSAGLRRLDVDDDVRPRDGPLDRLLDRVGGGMALARPPRRAARR